MKNQAKKSTKLTPEEEAFLCGSYKYQKSYKAFAKEQAEIGQEEEDGLSRFNESWPGSERPSSPRFGWILYLNLAGVLRCLCNMFFRRVAVRPFVLGTISAAAEENTLSCDFCSILRN